MPSTAFDYKRKIELSLGRGQACFEKGFKRQKYQNFKKILIQHSYILVWHYVYLREMCQYK